MPIIVVEGVDGSGKSTMIERIASISQKPVIIMHKQQPKSDNPFTEYVMPLQKMNLVDNLYLLDRWHVGELIYGPLYRGKSILDESTLEIVEQTLNVMGAIKIILTPNLQSIKQRLLIRGEDFVSSEHVEPIYNFYYEFGRARNYAMINTSRLDPYANALEVINNVVNR